MQFQHMRFILSHTIVLLLLLLLPIATRCHIDYTENIVTFGFLPRELVSVDSTNEAMKVSGILTAQWDVTPPNTTATTDASSDASSEGYDSYTTIDPNSVWQPKVLVLNNVEKGDMVLKPQNGITITRYYRGYKAFTAWARQFHFTCSFSIAWFPSDEHNCSLNLMATKIALPDFRIASYVARDSIDIANQLYNGNSEWQLLTFRLKNSTLTSASKSKEGPRNTPAFSFDYHIFAAEFTIRRKPTYYHVIIMTPLMVLTGLQLLPYLLPLQSNVRISGGVSVMLSSTMFLLLIDKIVPKTANVPTLAYFIAISMAVAGTSVMFNAMLSRMFGSPADKIAPSWLDWFLRRVSCSRNKFDVNCDLETQQKKASRMSMRQAAMQLEKVGMVVHCCIVAMMYSIYLFIAFRK